MDAAITKFIEQWRQAIGEAEKLGDTVHSVREAFDEAGFTDSDLDIAESFGRPFVRISAYIKSADDLRRIFAALAKRDIRRSDKKPFDCAEQMCRLYDFNVPLTLHANLVGDSCRRVEVGTAPVYEIVCA